MTQSSGKLRQWLIPRRPNYNIFLWVVIPSNLVLVLTIGITSGVIRGDVWGRVLVSLLMVIVGGSLALAVSIVSTLLTPQTVYRKSLPLALVAAYGPHLVGVYLGTSLALWIRMELVSEWQPIEKPYTLAIIVGFAIVWFLLGLLTNHLAEASDMRITHERELAHQVRELEISRGRVVFVQERLRKEIATYLHGKVQGGLWVVIHRLKECSQIMPTSSAEAQQMLNDAIRELQEVTENDVRLVSRQLHPSLLRVSLLAALNSLRDRFESTIPIDLDICPDVARLETIGGPRLAESVRLALYRVAEECLVNIVKHAHASKAWIYLGQPSPGTLCLTVEDNGRGFDSEDSVSGLGLRTMEDYLGAVGGSITISSHPGHGTRIAAQVAIETSNSSMLDQGDPASTANPYYPKPAQAARSSAA